MKIDKKDIRIFRTPDDNYGGGISSDTHIVMNVKPFTEYWLMAIELKTDTGDKFTSDIFGDLPGGVKESIKRNLNFCLENIARMTKQKVELI